MRIFWLSAFIGCTTGYGVMSKEICFRLADKGYEIYNVGDFAAHGIPWGVNMTVNTEKRNQIKILPSTQQGAGVVEYFVKRYKPDLIVIFWDPFPHLSYLKSINVPQIWYIPVDGPLTEKTVNLVEHCSKLISYSNFGYNELKKFFPLSKIDLIYHGINTKIFKKKDKVESRRMFNLPEDKIIFLSVFANVGVRKQIPQLLTAFKVFAKDKDDVVLFLYTNESDYPYGYNFRYLIKSLGIEDKVILPETNPLFDSLDDEDMVYLFNTADFYISSSEAEGFNIPLLQSLSCSVPTIATNNSAQSELANILFDPSIDYINYPLYVPYHTRYRPPSIPSLIIALEEAYKIRKEKKYKKLCKEARKKALKYDWKNIIPRWFKVLDEVVEDNEILRSIKIENYSIIK